MFGDQNFPPPQLPGQSFTSTSKYYAKARVKRHPQSFSYSSCSFGNPPDQQFCAGFGFRTSDNRPSAPFSNWKPPEGQFCGFEYASPASSPVPPEEPNTDSEKKKQKDNLETKQEDNLEKKQEDNLEKKQEKNLEKKQKNTQEKKQKKSLVKKQEKNPCVETFTQTVTELHVAKLMEGLKNLLLNGKYSDTTLNVKGKEFKVHKTILAAHSPVFAALMESENPVDIDADPDIFSEFLYFLYTGSTEKINSENVVDMYIVAKLYQVPELTTSCVKFMINHISLENFCNIMTLSLDYHEDELANMATQYFIKNSTDIAETAQWILFLKDNTIMGNALFLKALKTERKGI